MLEKMIRGHLQGDFTIKVVYHAILSACVAPAYLKHHNDHHQGMPVYKCLSVTTCSASLSSTPFHSCQTLLPVFLCVVSCRNVRARRFHFCKIGIPMILPVLLFQSSNTTPSLPERIVMIVTGLFFDVSRLAPSKFFTRTIWLWWRR